MKTGILAIIVTGLMVTSAQAATVTDATLYSAISVNDSYIYNFDLGNVNEAGTSSLDVRLGGWNGLVPSSGPYMSGDVIVNGVAVGTFDIYNAYYSTSFPTDTYNTTSFLQDGINTFEFSPTFVAPDYNEYAISDFSLSYVSAVPVPAAAWLFGSGLLGLVGVAHRKKVA